MPAYNRSLLMMLCAIAFITSCKKNAEIVVEKDPSPVSGIPIPPSGNYWTQLGTPDIPGIPPTNEYNFSFSVNNKLYVVLLGLNTLWEYDPITTGQWTQKQSTFYTFSDYNYTKVFNNSTSVYFLNATSKKLKEYNVANNQWTDKADFPGTAKEVGTFTSTATKGYIMGGTNGSHANGYKITLNENWEYDFTANTWMQKANTPGYGRYNSASYAVGDKVYFGTGISVIPFINPITLQITWIPLINSDWHEYNTLTNTWTQKAAYGGGARQDTRGFVIAGKVYVAMGSSGYFTNLKSDMWSYNPSSDSWTQRAGYPPGVVYPPYQTMLSVNNRGYSVLGVIQDFWRYTPPTIFLPTN
jgi:hypothetical protein